MAADRSSIAGNRQPFRVGQSPGPAVLALGLCVAVLSFSAAGCSSAPAEGASGVSEMDAPDRDLAVAFDSLYTVGAIEGESWETFGSLDMVGFDAAGNLFIFDRQNARVVAVGPDGRFLREIGKRGEGPGELRQPLAMVVTHDGNVGIVDFGASGFALFDAMGEFLRNVPIDMSAGLPTEGLTALPNENAVVTRGSGVRVRTRGGRGVSVGPEEEPTTIPVRKISLEDGSATTVHEAWRPPPPGEGERVEGATSGGQIAIQMARTVAFQPEVRLGVLPDGSYLVVDSTTYSINVLDSTGALVRTLERPIPPVAVTDDIEEMERTRRLEELEGSEGPRAVVAIGVGGGGSMSLGGEMQQQIQEMRRNAIESMLFGDVIPVIAGLGVEWSGRIWVERASARPGESGVIDVIDAEGGYHGTIGPDGPRIPAAFGPDGLVAYIERDDFDVPSVRVLRIRSE